ncbi:dinitrogenase iron-molybdenum cofactor [Corallincola luteus]|uniref:Dinitrogenase iron-molybdenum cofactor n=2 Tax=Corallincola luteus TaxID=1775177 RepID=A0ABY2AIR9_9GAMM|nr:dinitrogenase iron-molybdenum cofactor [Corallincola luteus]
MMTAPVSETAALRIALAAKALPQIPLSQLLSLLVDTLGEPLTEKKLRQLSPKQLREIFSAQPEQPDRVNLAQAFAIFNSNEVDTMEAPEVLPSVPLSGKKLRVAMTSNNGERLDGHFGSCLRVLVYEVNAEQHQLVDVRPVTCSESGEKRSEFMLSLISDCHILSTLSIGGPAAAKVTRANVHPIKQAQPGACSDVLERMQQVVGGKPAPWLQRLMESTERAVEGVPC